MRYWYMHIALFTTLFKETQGERLTNIEDGEIDGGEKQGISSKLW